MACFGEWLGGDVDKGDGCIAIGPFQNIRLGNDVIQVPVREVGAWLKSRSSSDRFECAGVLIFLEIGQSAAGQNLITLDQLKGFNIGGPWPAVHKVVRNPRSTPPEALRSFRSQSTSAGNPQSRIWYA